MHSRKTDRKKCPNKDIRAHILEDQVFKMMCKFLRDPEILKEHMDFFNRKAKKDFDKVEEELKNIDLKIQKESLRKKHILERYVERDISHDNYFKSNQEIDLNINTLNLEKRTLIENTPLLHKKEVVEDTIKKYCQNISDKILNLETFEDKREFLLKNISKVIFQLEKVEIQGFIPISDEIKLPFSIIENIPRSVRDVSGNVVKCSGERINLSEYVKLEKQNKQTL